MNTNTKLFSILALIFAVAISLTSTAVFADTEDIDDIEQVDTEDKKSKKDEIKNLINQLKDERKQLLEQFKDNPQDLGKNMKKLVDSYKDKIRPNFDNAIPHNEDSRPHPNDHKPDFAVLFDGERPDVEFFGDATGWAILGGNAYDSTISLAGTAAHIANGVWKVHSTGKIMISEHEAVLDLNGFARSGKIMLQGTGTLIGSDGEQEIRVKLKGHFAPIAESEDEFAIAFTQAVVHNTDTDHRIPLSLVGQITVIPLELDPIEPDIPSNPEIIPEILS